MPGKRVPGRPDLNRLRVRFGKDGRLAHLGHIELLNTIMRSIRRADLPFSVGNGFAKRMRIQFSQALPVGAASCGEYYDIYLTERIDSAWALERLVASTPTALAPCEAAYVQGRLPALEAWLTRSDWQITLYGTGDAFCAQGLDLALRNLREQGSINFMRGDKPRTIGLDDTLVSWGLQDVTDGRREKAIQMDLQTRSSNLGALRPAVLLDAAFGCPSLADAALASLRVERCAQWHEQPDGSRLDPLAESLLV